MPLKDGDSDLDQVTLRFSGLGVEIRNWERYRCTSRFLCPCDQFEFSVGDQDIDAALEVTQPGVAVDIAINDRTVLTGFIDKRIVASSRRGGTMLDVIGRDILGPVVSANIDPKFQFADSLTVLDVAAAVLTPFTITTIYNDGALNVNTQTGATQKPSTTAENASVQLPKLTVNDDGSLSTSFSTVQVKQIISKNPSLKTVQLQQLKPHFGEGAYEYLSRVCKRFGFHIWASADGSGVIIALPDFSGPPIYTLKHSRTDTDSNVIDGRAETDLDAQPSCIFASGGAQSPLFSDPKTILQCIMVNEIVGTDADGNILPDVQGIIARYKGAKVLPLRSQLQKARKSFNDSLISRPMFLKDDESRSIAQLEAFVRRKMAETQHKALLAHYTVEGHTQNGIPWTVNTMCNVEDDVAGINEPLWLMERTFEKSRIGGTVTHLTLVRPFTIALTA